MNTQQFLVSGWTWSPGLFLLCALAVAGYAAVFGFRARAWFFLAALGVFLLALASPISALADGYLFSAHMVQHTLLLLIVPALVLFSLPRSFALPGALRAFAHPAIGWAAGVGAMWFWHAPTLCNAAVTSKTVYAIQTISLLAMGGAFWWQTLAPREEQRITPLLGILYLFTACTACSVLGVILTFSPVTVCSIYAQPMDRLGMLETIRGGWGMTSDKDQQIGGLLMWVPMCMIYLSAIFAQIARWYGAPAVAAANPTLKNT
jgi:putative membrane protein